MDLSAVARQRFSHRSGEASLSAATSSRRTDDDEDEDDLDADEAKSLVRAFVKHALDGVRNGERAQYYELLEALDGLEAPDVAQDKLLMLTVLVECVSSLCETNHEELLRTVLGVNPWRCGEATALLVTEFCVNLVSTHTGSLLQTCLEMLVSFFTPPQGYDLALLDKDWLGDNAKERFGTSPSYASAMHGSGRSIDPHGTASLSTPGALRTAETVTAGVVTSVTTILTLVPLAASVLRTVLLRHVPHKSAHKNIQTQYLRCAFRVAETEIGKSLRDALLRGVTTHLLEVDVEITWEHIRDPGGDNGSGSDTDVEDDMDGDGEDGDRTNGFGAVDDVFELDDIEKTIEIEMTRQAAVWERDARQRAGGQFGRNKGGGNGYHRNGAASPAASSGNRETGPQSSFAVDEAADTLDGMMSAVLAHVDTRIDRGDLNGVGDCVLGIFLSTLLPAHTSKFTQFLVFHVCARDAADREPPRVGDSDESCLNLPFSSGNSFGASFGLSGRIVDALVERVTNPHHPPAGRLASAAYLASFLSRAAFLPPEFLTKALTRVTNWCVSLADSAASGSGVISVGQSVQKKSTITGGALARGFGSSFKIHESGVGEDGGSAEGPGLEIEIENGASTDGTGASEFATASAATLAVFDSACQCLMYVLVYRMDDVLKSGGAPAEALRSLPLLNALYNKLDPLKTCLPSVVLEFLHRASDARLPGFDDDLIGRHVAERKAAKHAKPGGDGCDVSSGQLAQTQTLRRVGSVVSVLGADVAEAVRSRRPLRMFFPFDPYLLRRSASLLRLPITYVAWRGEVRREIDDEDDLDDFDVDLDDETDLGSKMSYDDASASESDGETSDDDASEGTRGHDSRSGSRYGSHGGHQHHHGGFNNSLPNSLNPRPRKLTRGLLGPAPLFGNGCSGNAPGNGRGASVSPGSAEPGGPFPSRRVHSFGFAGGNGTAVAAAAPPIVGFGVPTTINASNAAGSPGAPLHETPPSPSRLGVSPTLHGARSSGKPPRAKRSAR